MQETRILCLVVLWMTEGFLSATDRTSGMSAVVAMTLSGLIVVRETWLLTFRTAEDET